MGNTYTCTYLFSYELLPTILGKKIEINAIETLVMVLNRQKLSLSMLLMVLIYRLQGNSKINIKLTEEQTEKNQSLFLLRLL